MRVGRHLGPGTRQHPLGLHRWLGWRHIQRCVRDEFQLSIMAWQRSHTNVSPVKSNNMHRHVITCHAPGCDFRCFFDYLPLLCHQVSLQCLPGNLKESSLRATLLFKQLSNVTAILWLLFIPFLISMEPIHKVLLIQLTLQIKCLSFLESF